MCVCVYMCVSLPIRLMHQGETPFASNQAETKAFFYVYSFLDFQFYSTALYRLLLIYYNFTQREKLLFSLLLSLFNHLHFVKCIFFLPLNELVTHSFPPSFDPL